jgi:hypothetical protein
MRWRTKRVGVGAAVIIIGLALVVGATRWRSTESTSMRSPEEPSQAAPAQPTSGPAATDSAAAPGHRAAAPKGSFTIKIGDRISDGVLGPGAGNVESPGAKDVYTFTAAAGQRVYFRKLKHDKNMEQIAWRLTDPDGREVFDSRLYDEPGVQLLRKGGTYTMSVGSDNAPATGTYTLQLFNVPPPHQFEIKIGNRIQQGVPAPGAGEIESPGVKDNYLFTAAPGQRVYFRKFGHGSGMEQIGWRLTDVDGTEVFDSRLYDEPGVHLLRKGGPYTMTVGSDRNPATGTYQLQLFDVPRPDQFAIKVGDTIGENTPGKGAGHIESPGAKDLYTFNAAAGQRVYFGKLEHDKGMEQIAWRLVDSDGMEIFDSRLYTEPGVQVLRKGGTYTMTVGSDKVPATGTYRLQLSNASGG